MEGRSHRTTYFTGHDGVRWDMPGFADGASISRSQLFDEVQILRPQIEVVLDPNFQLRRVSVTPVSTSRRSKARCFGRRRGLRRGGGSQGKVFVVLPLHGAERKRVGHVDGLGPQGRSADPARCWQSGGRKAADTPQR